MNCNQLNQYGPMHESDQIRHKNDKLSLSVIKFLLKNGDMSKNLKADKAITNDSLYECICQQDKI